MRDLQLLAFTLLAMRRLGGDRARLVQDGHPAPGWYAGAQPLNGQAVRDLLSGGWLSLLKGDSDQVRIDAWPNFATAQLHGAELLEAAREAAP